MTAPTTTAATSRSPKLVPVRSRNDDLVELATRIDAAGLLKTNPRYYARNTAIRLVLFAASIAFLFWVDILWLQLLNAVFLAIAFTQLGFLGHDAGHRQIFDTPRQNDQYGLVINGLIGLSRSWWIDTHNQHHVSPNDLERDPHTAIPIFAFSQEQALEKRGLPRFLVRYQAYYFFPILLLQGLGAKLASWQYLLSRGVRKNALELSILGLHLAVYFVLVYLALGVWAGIAFIAVHQAAFGLYMGSVFAPNHKGMPLMDPNSDFVRRQVLTSRNIKGGNVTDFVYGGLNYQIEHHLFQVMPRCNLPKAQIIVRAFCEERDIPYRISGALESHIEILRSLHDDSAPLRNPAAIPSGS